MYYMPQFKRALIVIVQKNSIYDIKYKRKLTKNEKKLILLFFVINQRNKLARIRRFLKVCLSWFAKPIPVSAVYLFLFFVSFSDPTRPPGVPVVWFPVGRTYSLSSLTFKRVTCRSAIKTQIPFPLLLQIHEGATGCLERTNNLGNLVTATPIWSPQGVLAVYVYDQDIMKNCNS